MGRSMRKSPSESALELSSSGEWDTIPAFQGGYGQGSKRQALATEVLGAAATTNHTLEWLRQQREKKGCSRSWQSGFFGMTSSQSPKAQWEFPTSSDSDSLGQLSSSTVRNSEEGVASCRRSFESVSSSKDDTESHREHFDLDSSSSLLSQQLSVDLGISERKLLLSSLTKREVAGRQELEPSFFRSSSRYLGSAPCIPSGSYLSLREPGLVTAGSARVYDSDAEEAGQEGSLLAASQQPLSARSRSSSYLYEGQAAAELFLRLNHARQTVSFVRNQAARFSSLQKAEMTVWEALEMLSSLREYETALMDHPDTDPNLPLVEHAFQTAEACRLAYPHDDWLHLVGLIHSLGKLLGHPSIAGGPQWAICGESFPVGCRFDSAIGFSQFFSVNPDRRCRGYNAPTGVYRLGGGLASVYMSWSACEYLYMLLLLNRTLLPPQALFIIRYQKFLSLEHSKAYQSLMCKSDQRYLPWLRRFRALSAYKQRSASEHLTGDAFKSYYSGLLRKYIPAGKLHF